MSRFYGEIYNPDVDFTYTDKCDVDGFRTELRGEAEGVEVIASQDEEGFDVFEVWVTHGKTDPEDRFLLATVRGGVGPTGESGTIVQPGEHMSGAVGALIDAARSGELENMVDGDTLQLKKRRDEGCREPRFAPGSIGDLITRGG